MPRSNKWTVRYGFCELEILWTHKQVIITRYPGGKKRYSESICLWCSYHDIKKGCFKRGQCVKEEMHNKPEVVTMSTKGFSSLANGFLKRWGKFKKSKTYRKYTS